MADCRGGARATLRKRPALLVSSAPMETAGGTTVTEHFDVLIVGAGLSGIGAACHLQTRCPDQRFAILEGARRASAAPGTCSAIRACAPIRTCTPSATRSAPGPAPRRSPTGRRSSTTCATPPASTASTGRSASATASCAPTGRASDARWTVRGGARRRRRAGALQLRLPVHVQRLLRLRRAATRPSFPARERFGGRIVHPQQWPEDLDYAGKRVVVIGSGATAVTLVPAMAAERRARDDAAALADLRSCRGRREDRLANAAAPRAAGSASPTRHALEERRCSACTSSGSAGDARRGRSSCCSAACAPGLGPDYDVETHFTPRYNPWDQRLCLVPDGDLFAALAAAARRSSPTRSRRFTDDRHALWSRRGARGRHRSSPPPGLTLQAFGGVAISVDGRPVDWPRRLELQGHDVQRRAQPGLGVRLHQRVVDAEVPT